MKRSFIASLLLLASTSSLAAESDDFTTDRSLVPEAAEVLNGRAQAYLQRAVSAANVRGTCDEDALYEEMRQFFGNHTKGQLVKDILYESAVPTSTVPLKQSIYAAWGKGDGFLLGRKKAATSPLALSPALKVAGQVIGVDKLEHMFGMGFFYFTRHHRRGKEQEKVVKYGVALEKTILGGNVLATGVFSYADLAANFNGMRFWNHVLQQHDDVLGAQYNAGPFVTCQQGQWSVNPEKPLRFEHYIDASMDEATNCSKFATRRGLRKFTQALADRGLHGCPLAPELLPGLRAKYEASGVVRFILNEEGPGKVSYFNEF